jgi:hypothetical protein
MAMSRKDEQRLLSHEEWQLVAATHQPEIAALGRAELVDQRRQLRALRDRERSLAHEKRRIARGKAEPRGGSFPGTQERPKERKQLFAAALKRVNAGIERLDAAEARAALVDAQRRALALKRRPRGYRRPANSPTAARGPAAVENAKGRTRVPGARVGSVSQQGKRAQAKRDG